MAQRSVLVVIVNHRSVGYLPALLGGVVDDPLVCEVVVRDNGSGTAEEVGLQALAARFPSVRVLTGGGNVGFGAGVNAAVAGATSDWTHVWVLNPDAAVRPGALPRLLDAADEHGWALVSPVIVSPSDDGEERIWFAGGEVDLVHGRASHGGVGKPLSSLDWQVRSVGFLSGAAPLIERRAWDTLRGFAEHYFLYWEDVDLSIRAARSGLGMGVVRDAVVVHDQGASSGGGVGPVYCYYGQRNRLWVLPDRRARWRVALGPGLRTTIDLLVMPLRSRYRSARSPSALLASVRGLVAGLRGPREAGASS